MDRLTTIELAKEYLKFSAAHFTIFSATERERLHGHNFTVSATITAPVDENGLCFRYSIFKQHLKKLCRSLDEYTLIAARSPHLIINEQESYYRVTFNNQDMLLLQSDTLLLPIKNTTVEELSYYLLDNLLTDNTIIADNNVQALAITVCSGPGQSGSACWSK